jgi:hypothetical protein
VQEEAKKMEQDLKNGHRRKSSKSLSKNTTKTSKPDVADKSFKN